MLIILKYLTCQEMYLLGKYDSIGEVGEGSTIKSSFEIRFMNTNSIEKNIVTC